MIQKYVDASISSTVNLPKGTSSDVVSEVYQKAYTSGCKGVTVYVEGSRSGVLLSKESQKRLLLHEATERPEELECDIHHITVKGDKWVAIVGLLDDMPYEVFGGLENKIELPKKHEKGIIRKKSRKTTNSIYDLIVGLDDDRMVLKDVVDLFDNSNYGSFTRMISLGLRHGSSVKYICEQLLKDKDSDLFSFSRVMARVLKKYILDGETASGICPNCGLGSLRFIEGCVSCACGWSKC